LIPLIARSAPGGHAQASPARVSIACRRSTRVCFSTPLLHGLLHKRHENARCELGIGLCADGQAERAQLGCWIHPCPSYGAANWTSEPIRDKPIHWSRTSLPGWTSATCTNATSTGASQ